MNREMYNPPIGVPREVPKEAPKHIVNPSEMAEVQKQAHILLGRIYAMGRNDAERSVIDGVIGDYQSGKITYTEALNQFNKIQETKDRGDYN